MAGCLSENTLVEFVEGQLSDARREEVERHIDACSVCRQLLAETANAFFHQSIAPTFEPETIDSPISDRARQEAARPLARGAAVGRYVIMRPIGAGGMGVVYAAYDPELNRKIALKLLRTDLTKNATTLRDRLLREAQAMARLSHADVITVYDVGTSDSQQVFVAMEFVEGGTIGQWLRAEPRSWREVLALFLHAGRGLQAAHAAGLVHRDFKPDNVLVGRDGRVRVTDFGLSRRVAAPSEPRTEGQSMAGVQWLEAGLTRTGGMVGTPAYMSPEQIDGQPTDARSDLFSFCVALYQGLYGERPFRADSIEELRQAIAAGQVREPPRGTKVPNRLRKILLRGLSADPNHRHPSMQALLDELAYDPGIVRRRIALSGIVVATVLGVAIGYRTMVQHSLQVCRGAAQQLDRLWSQRDAIERAFHATGKPFAEDSLRNVTEGFERFRESWTAMRTEACEATRLRGEQSEELLDLRMQCLDEHRQEAEALLQLLLGADGELVARAPEAVRGIEPLERCADAKALLAEVRPPRDPAVRSQVAELEARLAQASALLSAGKYQEGLVSAHAVSQAARGAGYRPLEAKAQLLEGDLRERTSDYAGAAESLEAAVWAAEAGRSDEVMVQALNGLAYVVGYRRAQPELGLLWGRQSRAILERLGGAPRLEAGLEHSWGWIERQRGDYHAAEAHYRRALELREKAHGKDHPEVASALTDPASLLRVEGQFSQALTLCQRARDIITRTLGPKHPETARFGMNVAIALRHLGRGSEAEREFSQALTLLERPRIDNPSLIGWVLFEQGALKVAQRDYRAALALEQRALTLLQQAMHDSPLIAGPLTWIGYAQVGLGSAPEGVEPLERALALRLASPDPLDLPVTRFGLAQALWEADSDRARARELATAARDGLAKMAVPPRALLLDEVEAWLEHHKL